MTLDIYKELSTPQRKFYLVWIKKIIKSKISLIPSIIRLIKPEYKEASFEFSPFEGGQYEVRNSTL